MFKGLFCVPLFCFGLEFVIWNVNLNQTKTWYYWPGEQMLWWPAQFKSISIFNQTTTTTTTNLSSHITESDTKKHFSNIFQIIQLRSQRCWFISQKIIHRTGRFQYSDSALVPRYTTENVKPNILLYVLQFGLFHKRFATFFQFHVWLRIPETTQKNWPLFHTAAFSTTNIYWIIFSISFSVRAMRAFKPSLDHA